MYKKVKLLSYKVTALLISTLVLLSCVPAGEIKAGQEFPIILETDWKSQTRWTVIKYDNNYVQYIRAFRQESADPHYSGQDRAQNIFYFKALKTGETDIVFKLEKIWGTGKYDEATRHIIIR